MADEADVGIVGAGPSGSTCAALLAERGYNVTIVDKDEFPRDKACGDGLTPRAVEVLRQLGLGKLVDDARPLHGYRLMIDHRNDLVTRFPSNTTGRCVPRSELDAALLDAAIAKGAKFIKARAEGIGPNGDASALLVDDQGETRKLTASRLLACDGATSVMRRSAGIEPVAHSVRAWAIRGYYEIEREMDDFFDIYVPLEVRGSLLVGYGWVFPLSGQVANIGVGYFRSRTAGAPPPFNATLESFVEELRTREVRRYGDIRPLGKPIGAPIAANFAPDRCSHGKMLFVGDAAGTTDPLTGEGIAAALDCGAIAAEHVHRSLAQGGSFTDYGRQVDRLMPRIRQDFSAIARTIGRLDDAGQDAGRARTRNVNFLLLSGAIGLDVELVTTDPDGTPVARLLRGLDPEAAARLRDAHDGLLDAFGSTFPLAKPALARELEVHGGPVYAATLICAHRACGADADDQISLGALASECLAPVATIISSRLSDQPRGKVEKFNNALAILSADFAVGQALAAVAKIGPNAAASFARAAQRVCEGGMVDAADRHDLDRSTERYLAAAESREGSIFGFAAALGAELGGSPPPVVEHFHRFGCMLGVAYNIAEDLKGLEPSGDQGKWALISSLRNGKYGLPILIAARKDPALRQKLVAGPSVRELPELIAQVRETGAIDEALESVDVCARSAEAALESAAPNDTANLEALISWIENRAGIGELAGSSAPVHA